MGNPYVSGGTSLTNGADCSGFTQSVFKNFGISIPRTSDAQGRAGREVSYSEAQAGDIIYYGGHVAGVAAIYSAVEEVAGHPVRSVYTINDLPGYASYDYRDCPYCKAGQKLDALVNSFGYSAL